MSVPSTFGALCAIASLALLYSVRRLSRLGRLKFAYSLGWVVVGITALMTSILAEVLRFFAQDIERPIQVLLSFGGVMFFLSLLMQLSISVSGLSKQNEQIAESFAKLEYLLSKDGSKFETPTN